jgi:hypothetical protein
MYFENLRTRSYGYVKYRIGKWSTAAQTTYNQKVWGSTMGQTPHIDKAKKLLRVRMILWHPSLLYYRFSIVLLLGPQLKNQFSYDYEVHSKMKSNLGNTTFHFFLIPEVSRNLKIKKLWHELMLLESNFYIYCILEKLT